VGQLELNFFQRCVHRMIGTKLRVIPVILWEGISSVKGESFVTWRKLGPILPAINVYLARNVDEIILLNVSPNKTGIDIDYRSIKKFFAKVNLPLSYGGGVRNLKQVSQLLACGVDKVVLGSVCYQDKGFVLECIQSLGSQFVIASVDYRYIDGTAMCFSKNGTVNEDIPAEEHICNLSNLGVGEIMLTNIEYEGHMKGYDLDLLKQVRSFIKVPIIINGGAGDDLEHFHSAFRAGADAVAASSTFLFTEITPRKVACYLLENNLNMRVL
jgi:imidazole glycerol-phosphate synthase subunit HisF